MPRTAKGPYLKFLEKRGVYFICWSRGRGRQGMRTTSTASPAEADAALRRFLEGEYRTLATPDQGRETGHIYFIGGDVGAIKIGFSVEPQKRLASLQCGSPIPLRILALAKGTRDMEWMYHRVHFHRSRIHGEWFERTPDLLAEIDRVNALGAP